MRATHALQLHCLVEIIDNEYELLAVSEDKNELTANQCSNPLRIVLSETTLQRSMLTKRERLHATKAIQTLDVATAESIH